MSKLRIAQLAPLGIAVPPIGYGGVERIVYNLTEELVKRGHDVTLFASADSKTSAKLEPVCPMPITYDEEHVEEIRFYGNKQISQVYSILEEFDVIHAHTAHFYPQVYHTAKKVRTPTVITLHHSPTHWKSLAVDAIAEIEVVEKYYTNGVITTALSESHKKTFGNLPINWGPTISNFIDIHKYDFSDQAGEYLAFIGKLVPEKGPDKAIEVALRLRMKLKLAGPVLDDAYYDEKLRKFVDHPLIEFVGELNDVQKNVFLGKAIALLFPVDWSEPFGLVMIEAMACGTPVVALNKGSVPEIINHSHTGFICNSVDEMVNAIPNITRIRRDTCRSEVEQHYSTEKVVRHYEKLYQDIMSHPEFF